MDTESTNGQPEAVEEVLEAQPEATEEHLLTMELTVAEAQAVKAFLLKPAGDGSQALDDPDCKSAMLKLGNALDYVEGVSVVRRALEEAGFVTEGLSDDQLADLGARISDTSLRRYAHQ